MNLTAYHLIMKRLILLLMLFLVCRAGTAQEKIKGQIFEGTTKTALAGISIENLNTHVKRVSDANGSFSIDAKVGDLLAFGSSNYEADTLYVTSGKKLQILLSLKTRSLNEVKVSAQEITAEKFNTTPITGPFNSKVIHYQTNDSGRNIGGIKIVIRNLGNHANKKNKTQRFLDNEQKKEEISRVFSPENLKNYLTIRDQELRNFITLYIPDIREYTASNFNLIVYLNDCYKEIPIKKRQSRDFLKLRDK